MVTKDVSTVSSSKRQLLLNCKGMLNYSAVLTDVMGSPTEFVSKTSSKEQFSLLSLHEVIAS